MKSLNTKGLIAMFATMLLSFNFANAINSVPIDMDSDNLFVSQRTVVTQSDDSVVFVLENYDITGDVVESSTLYRSYAEDDLDINYMSHLDGDFDGNIYNLSINNGKVIVAGDYSHYGNKERNYLVVLNADGTEDMDFYKNLGSGFDSYIIDTEVQADGKIIVYGAFTTLDGKSRNGIVRLNADGTEDVDFYNNLYNNNYFKDIASLNLYSIEVNQDSTITLGVYRSVEGDQVNVDYVTLDANGVAR